MARPAAVEKVVGQFKSQQPCPHTAHRMVRAPELPEQPSPMLAAHHLPPITKPTKHPAAQPPTWVSKGGIHLYAPNSRCLSRLYSARSDRPGSPWVCASGFCADGREEGAGGS